MVVPRLLLDRRRSAEALCHPSYDLVRGYAHLLERIPVADRYGSVFDRLTIDGNTPRSPDFVSTAVSTPDGTRLIVEAIDRVRATDRKFKGPFVAGSEVGWGTR